MPIKTLFTAGRGMRFPRLGIIRLGVVVPVMQGGQQLVRDGRPVTRPAEVDYFVVPPELAAIPEVGEKPKKIEVSFPAEDPDVVFDTAFVRYDGHLLTAKCDGEVCTLIPKEGPETSMACDRREDGPAKCGACGAEALGRLNVIVKHSPALGVYQVPIGGISRIRMLRTELEILQRAGLTKNWFSMDRRPQEVQVPTERGRMARTGWPVQVWLDRPPLAVLGPMTSVPALRAGDSQGLPDGVVPDIPDDNDEWDISMCYAEVVKWGVDADTYGKYLGAVYRGGVDNMTGAQIAQQQARIKAGIESQAERDKFAAAIRDVAAKAKR